MSIDKATLQQMLQNDAELHGAYLIRKATLASWQKLSQLIASPPHNFESLTPETLTNIAVDIINNPDGALTEFFLDQWRQLAKETTEHHYNLDSEDVLNQFLYYRIEAYFVPKGLSHIPGRTLSRNILSGYYEAIAVMLGQSMHQQYQDQAEKSIATLAAQPDYQLAWRLARSDESANTVTRDILVEIAHWFANPAKRYSWCNNIMQSKQSNTEQNVKNWYFDEIDYALMCWALFNEFFAKQKDADFQKKLQDDYGDEKVARLQQTLSAVYTYAQTAQQNYADQPE